MSDSLGQERVAYVSPAESTWCVSIRDGTGLAEGLFTTKNRIYYETVDEAAAAAERRVESGKADRVKHNVVAERYLND